VSAPSPGSQVNATRRYYLSLNSDTRNVIENASADPTDLGRAQEQIAELDRWREVLSNRPEGVALKHGIYEATVGLFLLASGLYRPAFVSLRLFLELSLASIHFSANRLDLAEWIGGRRDNKWSDLINSDTGVLSLRYADAFFPELRDSVAIHNAIGSKVYRELSEFVHGNHQTWGNSGDKIAFDINLQSCWLAHLSVASTTVNFALTLRFLKEVPKSELPNLSHVVLSCLGHIEAIGDYLRDPKNNQ
jgi:hypothetical protein